MANPAADYPSALHTNTDISAYAATALGSSAITHTAVEGKQEEEIKAAQTKIGTGSSTPTAGTVLTGTGTGTSSWAAPTGLAFTNVTGTTQAAAVDSGYIANNASLCTITLPSTATVGQVVAIVGSGAGGWLLAQNASQLVNFNTAVTTTGTGGSLASVNRYDCLEVVCIVTNTTWVVRSAVGNITVV